MKPSMIYFVLYIVLLAEIFVVIQERDELLGRVMKVNSELVKKIADSYGKEIKVDIPNRYSYKLGSESDHKVVISPFGLVTQEEKESVILCVEPVGEKRPNNWQNNEICSTDTGKNDFQIIKQNEHYIFTSKFNRKGLYKFQAYFHFMPTIDDNIKDKLIDTMMVYILENVKIRDSVKIRDTTRFYFTNKIDTNKISDRSKPFFNNIDSCESKKDTFSIFANPGKELPLEDLEIYD